MVRGLPGPLLGVFLDPFGLPRPLFSPGVVLSSTPALFFLVEPLGLPRGRLGPVSTGFCGTLYEPLGRPLPRLTSGCASGSGPGVSGPRF